VTLLALLNITHVATFEAKDHNGEFESWHFPALDKGRGDFPAVLRSLREHGFSGAVTLEIEGINVVPRTQAEIERDLADSVAYLRSMGNFK
jgi:sugar phosphate isomerase/epimerase